MPVLVEFKVKCDTCGAVWFVEVPVSNVIGRDPKFDTTMSELQADPQDGPGWEIKDVGSYKTKVLCPTCK